MALITLLALESLLPPWTTIQRQRPKVGATNRQVADRNFVQRLYSRSAFLAFLALLAFLEISNLRVLNAHHGFDSRRLHNINGLLSMTYAGMLMGNTQSFLYNSIPPSTKY
jgi:hypothetical protein